MKNLATKIHQGIAFVLLLAMASMLSACGAAKAVEEYVTITVDCRRSNLGEFLAPTHVYSFKVGDSCDIINPEFEGLVTAWPVIHLDEVQQDERFVVQYYDKDEITPEELAEMAGKRTVVVHYNYGNGALHIAPDQIMELPVGNSFTFLSPTIENYKPNIDKIADVVQTNCPPEGVKSYTVTYDFTGDPADEPFQVAVDYSFRTYGEISTVHCNRNVHKTDFYWYKEGDEISIELSKFVGFRAKEDCLTGKMERENQHFLAEYVEDPSQTEGEELHLTAADFAIATSEAAFEAKVGSLETSEG